MARHIPAPNQQDSVFLTVSEYLRFGKDSQHELRVVGQRIQIKRSFQGSCKFGGVQCVP